MGIETKYGNNTLSKWQKRQAVNIREAGGTVLVINETNIDSLRAYMAMKVNYEEYRPTTG